MKVELAELTEVWNRLVAHLAELGIDSVVLTQDYYWEVMAPERYDVYTKPTELTIGQISEDLVTVRNLLTEEHSPVVYDFVKLASVMRAIGEIGEATLLNHA